MKINEKRHLVLPIVTDLVTKKVEGKDVTEEVVRIYAHHTPVSREVFEANYRILAATKSALASKGSHYLMSSGPRIAALTLRDEGKKDAAARGSFDEQGRVVDEETPAFFAELKRLTMVLCPGQQGWDMLPIDAAIGAGKIDAEDWEEVASSLVFFTCHYAMARKADRETTANGTASLLGSSISSLAPTEFIASLPSWTPAAPTMPVQSSIPS
ncbi:hypothetical protein BGLT_02261 [Caballeronia glathei]|uniref:Uncharacterized protein n=1 Tax=Caballeronia glathei TaxID=60547 RepID=A0A069PW09_9BURK|nr:hypothetical protein [Caballeronia glathei]KDR41541.1 hypothetical protein BG61_16730 [Caballeronia glathei]CDY79480.1 hypothetical protein BGLT_02261 [Caballeronia glathei]